MKIYIDAINPFLKNTVNWINIYQLNNKKIKKTSLTYKKYL